MECSWCIQPSYGHYRRPLPGCAGEKDALPGEGNTSRRWLRLFVLPPRLPKLNGGVERAHRTHTEEFYEVTESSLDIAELGNELLEWERIYNTVRPHQALCYLTPSVFFELQKHR